MGKPKNVGGDTYLRTKEYAELLLENLAMDSQRFLDLMKDLIKCEKNLSEASFTISQLKKVFDGIGELCNHFRHIDVCLSQTDDCIAKQIKNIITERKKLGKRKK